MAVEHLKFELLNYKSLSDMRVDLSQYDVVVVEADNRVGKTSLIMGLLENFKAKSISNNPTKRGEREGEKRVTIKQNGIEYEIIHDFDASNPTGSFHALKGDKPVKNVTEIREILGEVNDLTIEELFNQAKTIPGRRKIIKDYFLNDLETKLKERLEYIEEQIKPRTGELIVERAAQNKMVENMKATVKIKPTEEQIKQVANLNSGAYEAKIKTLKETREKLESNHSLIVNLKTLFDVSIVEDSVKLHVAELLKYEDVVKSQVTTINANIEKGLGIIATAKVDRTMVEAYDNAIVSLETQEKELDKLNEHIEKLENEKEAIIKQAKLPAGVKILSESDFTVNGFDFSAADVSESEAWMILAEIIIKRFPSPYMRMGNASIYNKINLNKLAKMASENGKIIALERVVDNLKHIRMVGIVADKPDAIEIPIEDISAQAITADISNDIPKKVETTTETPNVDPQANKIAKKNEEVDTENNKERKFDIDF